MASSPSKTAGATASSVLITQLARGMRRRVEQAVAPLGLRPRQLLVLHHLRERGPSAQQTLLELLGIDPSNLVAVLNDLEDAGLIVRSRDRSDRRRGIIQLSGQGEAVLDDVDRALHRIDDELLGTLTAAQRSTLNGLLARAAEGVALDCTQDAAPDC
jgi:DNA-binding MarR family transcriptional regulator